MPLTNRHQKTVYVAMSGGVDSSVAAYLLTRDGYTVVGVFLKPWQPRGFSCMWEQDRADALRVASKLNIPLETWDFSREYARHVSRPMVDAYRHGSTPNPDVECNRHIKFGLFYGRAMKRGADAIATGHYARIEKMKTGHCQLTTARDSAKDQTYFLWGLRGAQLKKILFPVGNLLKSEVRVIARRAGLATAMKKDSQGVCFVGQLDMKQFLMRAIKPKTGRILRSDGAVLGHHDGAGYYTIGQRHGLDIKLGGGPYYVIEKDMRRNTVTVGPESQLYGTTARITALHWLNAKPAASASLSAKIRYRTPLVPVTLRGQAVRFKKPVKALTSGQSIVLYRGREVVGGAIIR